MNREVLFKELYEKHIAMVKQLCLGYCKGNLAHAEDLAQEVFINVWNGLEKFRAEASYKTWIYRIAINTCLISIRANSKQPETVTLTGEHDGTQANTSEDRVASLYQTIGSLPPVDRLIIMLVLEELTYEEISATLGMSEVNVRVKIHRIKNKMRQLLK